MAKSSKKLSQKVKKAIKSDVFTSIAIASVLFNILFLASLIVFTSTSLFDHSVFVAARDRYCKNVDAVRERAKELGSDQKAVNEWKVTCVSNDFRPFYQEAIDKLNASTQK